jgi:hypothetical protein
MKFFCRVCSCKRTQCSVCKSCLSEVGRWVNTTIATMTSKQQVAVVLGTFCRSSGRPSPVCNAIQEQILNSASPNFGKRAGRVCNALGECVQSALVNCSLTPDTSTEPATSGVPLGQLDLCTVEGVTGGTNVLGVSDSRSTPAGRCFATSDCKNPGFTCDTTTSSLICSCYEGEDTCAVLGYCVRTPCRVCSDCLEEMRDMQPTVSKRP